METTATLNKKSYKIALGPLFFSIFLEIFNKKIMRNLFVILSIFIFTSCANKGCNDPLAENYDSSVTKDNGTCLFSIVGDWEMQTYILNGDDLSSNFSEYIFHCYSDNSYWSEALILGQSNYIDVLGNFTLNDAHTELTLQNNQVDYNDGNGYQIENSSSSFSINSLTSDALNMSLTSSSNSTINSLELILRRI